MLSLSSECFSFLGVGCQCTPPPTAMCPKCLPTKVVPSTCCLTRVGTLCRSRGQTRSDHCLAGAAQGVCVFTRDGAQHNAKVMQASVKVKPARLHQGF
eukprot:scaffold124168_cov22-Tisochrysis_lutea.AAC.4